MFFSRPTSSRFLEALTFRLSTGAVRWASPRCCRRVADYWQKDRVKLVGQADEITAKLQHSSEDAGSALKPEVLRKTFDQMHEIYDSQHGGFGSAPKFPRPAGLEFLMRYGKDQHSDEAIAMVATTLKAMAAGGMHDQLGGGFHRYATDALWRVPHFEKMLYDQAQLALAYLHAYQISRDPVFAATARDTLDFVLREMRSPDGGFYFAHSTPIAHCQPTRVATWRAPTISGLSTQARTALK
jgi:uncharacterized protein YyaL (SSP411 family)